MDSARVIRTCTRCGYTWESKSIGTSDKYKEPKNCVNQKCKSPYWNKQRVNKLKPKEVKPQEPTL